MGKLILLCSYMLKVLRQAQLPKWRGYFKWQIEAQIAALQAAYARLRAEAAKKGG